MNSLFEVRSTMLPPQPPPMRQSGAVKWVRDNLLSSVTNVILTVLSIAAVAYIVAHLWPWFANSIWTTSSLDECRALRDELYGGPVPSACFSVITERWQQMVYGFYPRSEYWRPPAALVLFLVAIAPVLFSSLPRQMLILTAAAPFLLFFLLWGGSIWVPVGVAMGFAFFFIVNRYLGQRLGQGLTLLIGAALAILWWSLGDHSFVTILQGIAPISLPAVESKDFGGFTLSVIIGLSAIILSLPLGILLALGRSSDLPIINILSVVFIEVIRGVPLIVWLFTAQLLLNYFLPKGTSFDLMLRVIIMVTLFSSAYIAEVIRGGLAALPKGQREAAQALGLGYWESMRLIILPQALKISIPGIVNSFIGLFKDTTLVVFIGMLDPLGLATSIRSTTEWNGVYWELYLFIGAIFFVFCFGMSRYSMFLERKLQRDRR